MLTGPTPSWMRISRARYLTAIGRPMDADSEYRLVLSSTIYPVRERAAAAAYSADLLRHLGQYADAGQRARTALASSRFAAMPSGVRSLPAFSKSREMIVRGFMT